MDALGRHSPFFVGRTDSGARAGHRPTAQVLAADVGEVAEPGRQVDDAHVSKFPVGTGNPGVVNAHFRGDPRPWEKPALRTCLPALYRVGDRVSHLHPPAGIIPADADGHHVSLAQTIRPPSPMVSVPHPLGPASVSTMSSPWGRSPGF